MSVNLPALRFFCYQNLARLDQESAPDDATNETDTANNCGMLLSVLLSLDPGRVRQVGQGIPADRAVCQLITDKTSDSRPLEIRLISVR